MPFDASRGCRDCRRGPDGRILELCADGRRLHELDTASPAGANPELYRAFAVHVWGLERPPAGARAVPNGRPYPEPRPAPRLSGGRSPQDALERAAELPNAKRSTRRRPRQRR